MMEIELTTSKTKKKLKKYLSNAILLAIISKVKMMTNAMFMPSKIGSSDLCRLLILISSPISEYTVKKVIMIW